MGIHNPKPKVADGAILFLTVALMGAPAVLGDHVSHIMGQWMFWGGVGGLVLYVGWRWGGWLFGLMGSEESHASDGGFHVGRDNIGGSHIVNNYGPIVHGAPQHPSFPPPQEAKRSPLEKFRDEQTLKLLRGMPLQLDVADASEFFEVTGRQSTYTHKRTLKIRVSNSGRSKTLNDCKLQVLQIEPREFTGPWTLREGFSVAAGDQIFVPLVSYTEADDHKKSPYGATFMEILAAKNKLLPSANIKHVLTIRATAKDTAYCDLKCSLWIEEGRLRVEKLV